MDTKTTLHNRRGFIKKGLAVGALTWAAPTITSSRLNYAYAGSRSPVGSPKSTGQPGGTGQPASTPPPGTPLTQNSNGATLDSSSVESLESSSDTSGAFSTMSASPADAGSQPVAVRGASRKGRSSRGKLSASAGPIAGAAQDGSPAAKAVGGSRKARIKASRVAADGRQGGQKHSLGEVAALGAATAALVGGVFAMSKKDGEVPEPAPGS